ncbi:hypothetical protein RRG08_040140 [Elysia crispata]|uniref:Uncharacterized protein n=1 Tax=Elysia crispata TaxID=231223 RepID=A0AAE1CNP9_9GAST|nr:hypothetical protein RRG08_040140 [Elysia crispata]
MKCEFKAFSTTLVGTSRLCEYSYLVLILNFARIAALVGLLSQRFPTTTGSLAPATCTWVLHFIVTSEKTRRRLLHPKKSGDSSLQAFSWLRKFCTEKLHATVETPTGTFSHPRQTPCLPKPRDE